MRPALLPHILHFSWAASTSALWLRGRRWPLVPGIEALVGVDDLSSIQRMSNIIPGRVDIVQGTRAVRAQWIWIQGARHALLLHLLRFSWAASTSALWLRGRRWPLVPGIEPLVGVDDLSSIQRMSNIIPGRADIVQGTRAVRARWIWIQGARRALLLHLLRFSWAASTSSLRMHGGRWRVWGQRIRVETLSLLRWHFPFSGIPLNF